MSGLFKQIGDKIRSFFGSTDEDNQFDPLSFRDLVTTLAASTQALSDFYKLPTVANLIKQKLENPSLDAFRFDKAYLLYTSNLESGLRRSENSSPMSTVAAALSAATLTLAKVESNFSTIFDSSASIATPELRVSQAYVIGQVRLIHRLVKWATYMSNMVTTPKDDGDAVPMYQINSAIGEAPYLGKVAVAIIATPNTLINTITSIRRSNKDVALATDGHTLDNFIRDDDVSGAVQVAMGNFLPSPTLAFGKWRISRERAELDELKYIQNWLRNKISLLQLDMARTDPNSPEYRKLKSYVDNYMQDLARTDKEIMRYASV